MSDPIETEALVVRSVDYREHDKIVTLLTSTLGKRGAIAYGARRSRKRFAGALQPYQVIRVMLEVKRGRDLLWLTEAEVVRDFPRIPSDPACHGCASYALELLRELTPEAEKDPRPVELLVRFLERLDEYGASPSLIAGLILMALRDTGFAPVLDRCAHCSRPAPRGRAAFFDVSRGIVCSECGGSGPVLRGRVRQGLITASRWGELEHCSEAELVTGVKLLCSFAHHQLGKELRSWAIVARWLERLAEGEGAS